MTFVQYSIFHFESDPVGSLFSALIVRRSLFEQPSCEAV
jgi:hypothetical protein